MYQIKDYKLVFLKVYIPILSIIFLSYFWTTIQPFRESGTLSEIFQIAHMVIPLILLCMVTYVFFIFKNYVPGIIIHSDTNIIEYPRLFKRKKSNIYDVNNMGDPESYNGIYTANMTGEGSPIIFQASSNVKINDIAAKMRLVKNID